MLTQKESIQFPDFCDQQISPETEAELEILGFACCEIEVPFLGEQQVVEPIGYGIVEEGGNPEEPFGNQKDSFDQDFEFEVLPQINRSKIAWTRLLMAV